MEWVILVLGSFMMVGGVVLVGRHYGRPGDAAAMLDVGRMEWVMIGSALAALGVLLLILGVADVVALSRGIF